MPARSMTGFGAAERSGERGRVRAEVRSLNHRFLEVAMLIPSFLTPRESELRALVGDRVRRARVDVRLTWQPSAAEEPRVRVDRALLAALHRDLEAARKDLGLPGEVDVEVLSRFPAVVRVEDEPEAADETTFALVKGCLEDALVQHDRVRLTEGGVLARDLAARITELEILTEAATRATEAEPARIAQRLRERLQPLLGEARLDAERLHQEVALLADRVDVTEELVRLRAHLTRARELLAGEDELGKPFDFLLQEMGREVNTLGSKSRAPEVSGCVLTMKAEMEKIREQARNLE